MDICNMEAGCLYMSMTVLPERLNSDFFEDVIKHLKLQTQRFEKLIINVPHVYRRTGVRYELPEWLLCEAKILINRCEDVGPATKILGYYDKLRPSDIVCIVDDDIIYKSDMLENLYRLYMSNDKCIVSTYVDKFNSPTGFSGYIFRKGDFEITEADIKDLSENCFYVDDTWVGKIARQKKIKVVGLSRNWLASMDQKLTDKHPSWYELCEATHRPQAIKKCLCSFRLEKYESLLTN